MIDCAQVSSIMVVDLQWKESRLTRYNWEDFDILFMVNRGAVAKVKVFELYAH